MRKTRESRRGVLQDQPMRWQREVRVVYELALLVFGQRFGGDQQAIRDES
jgi:hypothetical protein